MNYNTLTKITREQSYIKVLKRSTFHSASLAQVLKTGKGDRLGSMLKCRGGRLDLRDTIHVYDIADASTPIQARGGREIDNAGQVHGGRLDIRDTRDRPSYN